MTADKDRIRAEALNDAHRHLRQAKGHPAISFLGPGIYGGTRNEKGFEGLLRRANLLPPDWYAVPARGAGLDAYGNVPRSRLNQILSQLQASRDPLTRENPSKKAKRNRTAIRGRYFAVVPGAARSKHLKPGIYERLGSSFGAGLRMVFVYTQKRPSYSKRYRFFEIADQVARERWPFEFYFYMERALATMR
jgi:hypothetical protein